MCATTWMNRESIMLRGSSQSRETRDCMILLHEIPRVGESVETGSRLVVLWGWGRQYNGHGR